MIDPRAWLRVDLRARSELEADLASDAMVAAGAAAVHQDGLQLTTYLPLDGPPERGLEDLRRALVRAGLTPPSHALAWGVEEDRDWAAAWKEGLAPRRVGDRIVVHPTWTEPELRPGDVAIAIDPGLAFGTGEHATTRGALRLLQGAVPPGGRVLDAGTGSGILAIAALRLGAGSVLAVDVDPQAIETARANLSANGVSAAATTVVGEVTPRWLATEPGFDLILANILSGPLRGLLRPMADALTDAGRLIVSGVLVEEAASFERAAETALLRLERADAEDDGWSALFSRSGGEA